MPKPNAYLQKQHAIQQAFFDEGVRAGRQQILDMMTIVLNDAEVMGKNTFGKDRLLKVILAIDKELTTYNLAWQAHDETDYWRAKLDAKLAEIYDKELHDTFSERYPFAPDYDYLKGKWK